MYGHGLVRVGSAWAIGEALVKPMSRRKAWRAVMRDIMFVEVLVLVVARWMFVCMELRFGGG